MTGLVQCRGVCQWHGAAQLSDEAPNRQTDRQTNKQADREITAAESSKLDFKYSSFIYLTY